MVELTLFGARCEDVTDGSVITFGQRRGRNGWTTNGKRTRLGETHPLVRWDTAVRRVLDPTAAHGLRHVHRRGAHDACPVTHVTSRGNDRFFDHILVSSDLRVVECGFQHGWRTSKLSDHSAAWAELAFGITRSGSLSA